MLNIFLARHGEDTDNRKNILNGHRDTQLTDKGVKQAQLLAKRLSNLNISFEHAYSSPLKRAYQTGSIITNKLKIKSPKVCDLLIERNFGELTGQHKDRIDELCGPNILKAPNVTYFLAPKNGETFPFVIKRAKLVLSRIKKSHNSGNILVTTHGDIGKMIYATYYNKPWKDVLKMFDFKNSDVLILSENPSLRRMMFANE